jgi:hypothetical protein
LTNNVVLHGAVVFFPFPFDKLEAETFALVGVPKDQEKKQ